MKKFSGGESDNVNHAITLLGIKPLNDSQIEQAINEIILENRVLVTEKGRSCNGITNGEDACQYLEAKLTEQRSILSSKKV